MSGWIKNNCLWAPLLFDCCNHVGVAMNDNNSTSLPLVIVVGSHADKVKESLQHKLFQLKGHVSNELPGFCGASIFPLDYRLLSGDNLQSFIKSLSH